MRSWAWILTVDQVAVAADAEQSMPRYHLGTFIRPRIHCNILAIPLIWIDIVYMYTYCIVGRAERLHIISLPGARASS